MQSHMTACHSSYNCTHLRSDVIKPVCALINGSTRIVVENKRSIFDDTVSQFKKMRSDFSCTMVTVESFGDKAM